MTLREIRYRTFWHGCSFRPFLTLDKGAVAIDAAAIEADARFDGIFILRTNTDVPADEVARLYKGLWRVERAFREVKSTLEIRPIYHQNDSARSTTRTTKPASATWSPASWHCAWKSTCSAASMPPA